MFLATDVALSSVAIIGTIGASVIIWWLKQRVSKSAVGLLSVSCIYQSHPQTDPNDLFFTKKKGSCHFFSTLQFNYTCCACEGKVKFPLLRFDS